MITKMQLMFGWEGLFVSGAKANSSFARKRTDESESKIMLKFVCFDETSVSYSHVIGKSNRIRY